MRTAVRLAAALATVVALALPVPAARAAASWQPDAPSWDVLMLNNLPITMSDGVTLYANAGVPIPKGSGATQPVPGLRFPVLIEQTPYRKDGGLFTVDPWFVQRGYAFVVVDVRGTGSSEGQWTSFGPREQEDGPAIVRWAAHRPWANGRAGLLGGSYLAINQLLTMEQPDAPSEVKAIFPAAVMSDTYRDISFHGGDFDDAFLIPWMGLTTGLGVPPASQGGSDTLTVLGDHAQGALQWQVPTTLNVATGGGDSFDGSFHTVRSPITHIDRVRVPTFVVGGEYDIFQRGEPLIYQKLVNAPAKRLIIGPWYHLQAAGGTNGNTDGTGGTPDLHLLELQWFDQYVRGVGAGEPAQPRVIQWDLGANGGSGGWVSSSTWPVAGESAQRWYLDGATSGSAQSLNDGSLAASPPLTPGGASLPDLENGACSRTTFQWGDATGTLVGIPNLPCETDERPNELTSLTFSSPPLAAPLTVNGPIDVHLVAALQSGQSFPFTVRLTDVHPDGTSTQVTAGWLQAVLRATAPNTVSEQLDGDTLRVYHPFTRSSQQTLPAATPVGYDVEVFPTLATFAAGDRLRIDISGGDVPHELPSAPHTVQDAGAVVQVDYGLGSMSSYVTLPVTPALDAVPGDPSVPPQPA